MHTVLKGQKRVVLNISMKAVHDFVKNSLTLIFFCLLYLDMSLPDNLYMLP